MRTDLLLFTRDLRVHDHPGLVAAAEGADHLVALFVLDDTILRSRYAAPNRVSHLVDSLRELRGALRDRGGELLVRRGVTVEVVRELAEQHDVAALHVTGDVSGYASRRARGLRDVADERGARLHVHPGVTLVDPGSITSSSGGPFKVFTPYWRRWQAAPHRPPVPAPQRVPGPPAGLDAGGIPDAGDLVDGDLAPDPPPAGESAALERLAWWLDGPIEDYGDGHDDLAVDGTSKLSPYLHLGTLSVAEVVDRLDLRHRGHEPFLRQLCWREFNHQLMAARPELTHTDIRSQGDRWSDEDDAFTAWTEGRTGYPVVDAGMRQLQREGWMHNRARLLTASFLTKHLRIDWRRGAWHFMDHLVDGDLANNFSQWQWTAGTGTDSRPNRMFNPVTQAERYDPTGAYVRRYVPELADVDDAHLHAPWEAEGTLFAGSGLDGYPAPIVDHREARERFLADRSA